MEENKITKKDLLKLDFAKTAYKKSADDYENTVKKFSSLLIALSSIITAVAGLFTCYCICSPKDNLANYILFAFNCALILLTLFTDLYGYGLFEKLKRNEDKETYKFNATRKHIEIENEVQAEINTTEIIETYLYSANELDEQTEKKKSILKLAMIFTAFTAVVVLVTVVTLLII